MDYIGDSLDAVAAWIGHWLYDGWGHSYPADHRHRCRTGPNHSGTKNIVAIWTLAGEGEVSGKEEIRRYGRILSKSTMASIENVS